MLLPVLRMTLETGARLGPYQIEAPLGAGGMGEVYRARDTRLDRPVAIKVLPSELADSTELRDRFEREARLISSLNHPHICVVYDVGRQDGLSYLVMELLEGETLAARLARGPLPIREATSVALQVGSALDRAHRVGIVHRDVKPENVMLTRSGAKLLDFGLAKPLPVTANFTGPTEGLPITGEGKILGTLQYMAPEQLEGKQADARSDIFAFGAVLYEMITGKRAFDGNTPVSVISSILRDTPRPIVEMQPFVPPALDAIVRTCLEKDPDERWHSTHDLASQLRWIQQTASQPSMPLPIAGRRVRREHAAWALVGALAFLAALAGIRSMRTTPAAPVIQFDVGEPPGAQFNPRNLLAPAPAVSPDGRHIVFTSMVGGRGRLFVHALATGHSRMLTGIEGAILPFWSADSRYVGYFADGALKKTDIASGGVETICKLDGFQGASWNTRNVVLLSKGTGGLFTVDGSGGDPRPATTLDASRKESVHRWPVFLPDGDHFTYLAHPGNAVYYSSLSRATPRRLLVADGRAVYSPPGYLLFSREGALFAQAFDSTSVDVRGDPIRIADNVRVTAANGGATYTVSETGVLVYRAGNAQIKSEVRWVDRDGTRGDAILEPGDYRQVALSPDGRRMAFHRHEEPIGGGIWIKDLAGGQVVRLTAHPSHNSDPVWNRDGTRIGFASNRNGRTDFFVQAASGTGTDEPLYQSGELKYSPTWSADERLLLYRSVTENQSDIWIVPLAGDGKPRAFIRSAFNEMQPRFSPDMKWIAYVSDESGRYEVYVQPYPANGQRYSISANGGIQPTWRGDGMELVFLTPSGALNAVTVNTEARPFDNVKPRVLFQVDIAGVDLAAGNVYDMSRDGQRFVVADRPSTGQTASVEPLTVVVNWTAGLQRAR